MRENNLISLKSILHVNVIHKDSADQFSTSTSLVAVFASVEIFWWQYIIAKLVNVNFECMRECYESDN